MSIEFVYIHVSARLRVRSGILRTRDVLKVERTSRGFEQYGNLWEHLEWLKNEKTASMA